MNSKNMNIANSYRNDWLLMYQKGNLEQIIAESIDMIRNDGDFTDTWMNYSYGYPTWAHFGSWFASRVWADMLNRCSPPYESKIFERAKLKEVLKTRGLRLGKEIIDDGFNLEINLKNGTYYLYNSDKGAAAQVETNRVRSWHELLPIAFLGEEGFADFIYHFDEVIPTIKECINDIWREVDDAARKYRSKNERLKKMLKIMTLAMKMKGENIDYKFHIDGDNVKLHFEHIEYKRIEETVPFKEVGCFLESLPELVKKIEPRVSPGEQIWFDITPKTKDIYEPRDNIWEKLVPKDNQEKEE